jgi:lysophospholipase L1-like esterase
MLKRAAVRLLLCSIAVTPGQSAADVHWIEAWAAAPDSPGPAMGAKTIRQAIRISIGGSSVRIRLSNLFGTAPVTIGPVHVAVHATGSGIHLETDHAVKFGGKSTVTIGKGADALSDSVSFPVKALQELAVSLYLAPQSGPSTIHGDGKQTAFISGIGDVTGAEKFSSAETATNRFFLTDVEVVAGANARAIAMLGDSITDGSGSTPDRNARWPDALVDRLQADPALSSIAVFNAGISGNRILNDGPVGPSALSRFDRDVLNKPGVRWILLLEGINDIIVARVPQSPKDDVSAEQVIDGIKSLIARAHQKGIKIWGATLTPFCGTRPYYSAAGEKKRQAVNAWIRTAGAFDAIVDFDQATRDPARPDRFLPAYDSGDHLHPGDAGYKAMAALIDLRLFARDK